MPSIRALIADDHPSVIDGLQAILSHYDIDVTTKALQPSDAVLAFDAQQHDVAILDVSFGPGQTGMDVARAILRKFPAARILFYSQFDGLEFIKEAYSLGALAFVPKNAPTKTFVDAIRLVSTGQRYMYQPIAEKLAYFDIERDSRVDSSPLSKLNQRERRVFKLMAKGLTQKEMADQMGLSPKTIFIASDSVRRVLGVSKRADIVALAIKLGVLVD